MAMQSEPTQPRILYANSSGTSPYVLSVFVALREKALPFELRPVALERGAQHEPPFALQSITSRVPVLVEGDFALSESSAIVEYLDEVYAAPRYPRVLPEDVRDRARARQIMAWIRSDLMPIREQRSAEYVFYPGAELRPLAPLSDAGLRAADKLYAAADRLVPDGAGPLFGAWCAADTDLAMMLQRLVKTSSDVPAKLRAFAEAQWQRPAVQEFVAQRRPPFAPST
jgi:glutathione S-transferase